MVYKERVGDYPLLDHPCKYWWVRYGTGCTFLKTCQESIWKQRLADMEKKYNFKGWSSVGSWKLSEVDMDFNKLKECKIYVYQMKNGEEKRFEVSNICSELYHVLKTYLQDEIEWGDCPYSFDYQSKCPFYEATYTDTPIEELRNRKGYEC